jgi:hypothetical protein
MNNPRIGSDGGSRLQAVVSDAQRNAAANKVKERQESNEKSESKAAERAESKEEGPTGSLDVSA